MTDEPMKDPELTQRECLCMLRDELEAAVESGDDARVEGTVAAAAAYLEILARKNR